MFGVILLLCHLYACFWIYLGDKYFFEDANEPWLVANSSSFGDYKDDQIYIFSFYWIMETISTVGYGDYSGGTKAEYLFTMIVQFSGLTLCSVLMFSANQLFAEDFTFENYIEGKY